MTPSAIFFEWTLLGMLSSGYLAIVASGALDPISISLAGLAILTRAALVSRILRIRLSEPWVNAAALAYIGFYPIDYSYISREFLPATVHLVFFLASVLILRARTRRDFFFVKLSAFLQIVAAGILTSGILFLICLGLFILCAIGAQVSGEIEEGYRYSPTVARTSARGTSRRLALLSFAVFFGVMGLAGGFFVILPRTAHAAFQRLAASGIHLPGFSNEVRLGQIGEIRQTSTPVMHVRIVNSSERLALKWRGSALGQFDGQRWYNEPQAGERLLIENGQVALGGSPSRARRGHSITYEVQLKNVTSDVLFFAGIPEMLLIDAPQVLRTPVDSYRLGAGFGNGMRYQVYGFLENDRAAPLRDRIRLEEKQHQYYTRTPAVDRRLRELAYSVTAEASDAVSKARALENHLRTSYGYTTQLLDKPVADPLANFLFERKLGHCEYFASAMAVMLRTLGIPSRVATGFQSGTYNPLTNWYLVRTSDAHSWVEAWVDGYGWMTFDPTPPDPSPQRATVYSQLALYIDALDVFWQDWVLSYDLQRQIVLADRIGQRSRSFSMDWFERWSDWKQWFSTNGRPLAEGMLSALAIAAGTLLLFSFCVPWLVEDWRTRRRLARVKRGRASPSDATLLYERMLKLLGKRGLAKPSWMTPREFAAVIQEPAAAGIVGEITKQYNLLRFGERPGIAQQAAREMVALLDRLERAPAKARRS